MTRFSDDARDAVRARAPAMPVLAKKTDARHFAALRGIDGSGRISKPKEFAWESPSP
jgi:hypothetical protein